jgi:hypothetical protein
MGGVVLFVLLSSQEELLGLLCFACACCVSSQAALRNSRAHAGLNVLLISRSESKLKTAAEEIANAFGVKVCSTAGEHPLASS